MNNAAKTVIVNAVNAQFKDTAQTLTCRLSKTPTETDIIEMMSKLINAFNDRTMAVNAACGIGDENAKLVWNMKGREE